MGPATRRPYTRHYPLYEQVVGTKGRAWLRFLRSHRETFCCFPVEKGKIYRLRLVSNEDWKVADECEARKRAVTHEMAVGP